MIGGVLILIVMFVVGPIAIFAGGAIWSAVLSYFYPSESPEA